MTDSEKPEPTSSTPLFSQDVIDEWDRSGKRFSIFLGGVWVAFVLLLVWLFVNRPGDMF